MKRLPFALNLAPFALGVVAFFGFAGSAAGQESFPLWPNGAPGALGTDAKDTPTLTAYIPSDTPASHPAIIICPGGGYTHLSEHEGKGFAQFLSDRGVSCFVLKYRLGSDGYRHPAMLQDAARAVRLLRADAGRWNIDPKRLGMMGSSAGGHLTATLMTHFDAGDPAATDPVDRQSSRPDFAVLCYPVITMGDATHAGSRKALLGDNPPPELVADLSNEQRVRGDSPPCFIFAGMDDKAVPVQNSIDFALALRDHKVPVELHLCQHAPHGMGLGDKVYPFKDAAPWTEDLLAWLRLQKVNTVTPTTHPAPRPVQ